MLLLRCCSWYCVVVVPLFLRCSCIIALVYSACLVGVVVVGCVVGVGGIGCRA